MSISYHIFYYGLAIGTYLPLSVAIKTSEMYVKQEILISSTINEIHISTPIAIFSITIGYKFNPSTSRKITKYKLSFLAIPTNNKTDVMMYGIPSTAQTETRCDKIAMQSITMLRIAFMTAISQFKIINFSTSNIIYNEKSFLFCFSTFLYLFYLR